MEVYWNEFYGCFISLYRKVHVTQQTLDLLEGEYFYEPGTKAAKNDPLLVNNDIETFLISPQYYGDVNVRLLCCSRCTKYNDLLPFQHYTPDEVSRRYSSGIKKIIERTAVRKHFTHSHCLKLMVFFPPILTEKRATAAHSKEFHAKFYGTLHGNYETDEYRDGTRTRQNANREISVCHSIFA